MSRADRLTELIASSTSTYLLVARLSLSLSLSLRTKSILLNTNFLRSRNINLPIEITIYTGEEIVRDKREIKSTGK